MITSTPAEKALLVTATGCEPVELQLERRGAIDHAHGDPGLFRDRLLHRYETAVFPTVAVCLGTLRGPWSPGSVHIR
jgi:hypothetical protein